jgi:hypothetical protein
MLLSPCAAGVHRVSPSGIVGLGTAVALTILVAHARRRHVHRRAAVRVIGRHLDGRRARGGEARHDATKQCTGRVGDASQPNDGRIGQRRRSTRPGCSRISPTLRLGESYRVDTTALDSSRRGCAALGELGAVAGSCTNWRTCRCDWLEADLRSARAGQTGRRRQLDVARRGPAVVYWALQQGA